MDQTPTPEPSSTPPAGRSAREERPTPHQVAIDLRAVVVRLLRRLRETPAERTLTPPQASAMSRLSKGGESTVSALALAEKVRPQSMAATVEALEERGFVSKSRDPQDGRRQIVEVTELGWAEIDGQRKAAAAWLEATLEAGVSSEELETLADAATILERILE
ncbi:MarR family winged helix-turn-helix transcriptional regulator [Dietzia sp.]|uniref:MarR family winged helix-turn-helix transcriptional regulator n=1 Tax=Dietzia sp. TaxID=1871616 RepID=UPI002FDAFC4B